MIVDVARIGQMLAGGQLARGRGAGVLAQGR
jgi:hypothetical protein